MPRYPTGSVMDGRLFTDMVMGRCKTEPHYDEIEALVAEYPWFSAAKVLLLRHYVAVGNREREAELRAGLATVLHAGGRYAVSVSGGRKRARGQVFVEDADIIGTESADERRDERDDTAVCGGRCGSHTSRRRGASRCGPVVVRAR